MKTLKEQLIKKGFAQEPENQGKDVGEVLVTGELQQSAHDEIAAIGRSIYRSKHRLWERRERHGRTKTVEVKKMMEEMKIDRDTSTYKLIALMRKDFTLMNVIEIHATFIKEIRMTTHAAVQQMVSKLYRSGVLVAESVVGSVGMKYKIMNPALSADELYIKYIEWLRNAGKKKETVKKVVHSVPVVGTGGFDFKGLRDALKGVIPDTITVNINHRVEVVFTIEKKGKK
jgi:hypothetical protein